MSRHMQIKISVTPCYDKNLEAAYPKLGGILRRGSRIPADRDPSLYELAGKVDELLYHFDGTELREVLLKHAKKLQEAFNQARDSIADRNPSRADTFLYAIEDIFDEIEADLD